MQQTRDEAVNSESRRHRVYRLALAAVREALLVIFSVVVALQINAAYEAKQERRFERTMLHDIRQAVAATINHVDSVLVPRLEEGAAATQRAIDLLQQGSTSRDSLDPAVRGSQIWILPTINRGAYDALKAAGIDKVRNDSLRAHLIEFFDSRLPRTLTFIEGAARDRSQADDDAAPHLWRYQFARDSAQSTIIVPVLDSSEAVLQSSLLPLLMHRAQTYARARFRLAPLREDAADLLTRLNAEVGE